jgi:hypothetical protein
MAGCCQPWGHKSVCGVIILISILKVTKTNNCLWAETGIATSPEAAMSGAHGESSQTGEAGCAYASMMIFPIFE